MPRLWGLDRPFALAPLWSRLHCVLASLFRLAWILGLSIIALLIAANQLWAYLNARSTRRYYERWQQFFATRG